MNMDFTRIQNQTKKPRGQGCEAITTTLAFVYSFVLDTQELDSSHLRLTLVLKALKNSASLHFPTLEKISKIDLSSNNIIWLSFVILRGERC